MGPFHRSRVSSYNDAPCPIDLFRKNTLFAVASRTCRSIVHDNESVPSFSDSTSSSGNAKDRPVDSDSSITGTQESTVVGRWLADAKRVLADETCLRIESFVANHLVEAARSQDGCSRLFKDPADGSLWECSYIHRELQGSEPLTLHSVSPLQARWIYGYDT
jgi:hypothetical protein